MARRLRPRTRPPRPPCSTSPSDVDDGRPWQAATGPPRNASEQVVKQCCRRTEVSDATETLNLALEASGLDGMKVGHQSSLSSDSRSSYLAGDLGDSSLSRRAWTMSGGGRFKPRPTTRSSPGIKLSRTTYCSRTNARLANSSRSSVTSSPTTTISGTTRASTNLTPGEVYFRSRSDNPSGKRRDQT